MTPRRKETSELLDDVEIQVEDKNYTHRRIQKYNDAMTNIGVAAIYVTPLLLLLWLLLMMWHFATIGDWNSIQQYGFTLLGVVSGYTLRHLQQHTNVK